MSNAATADEQPRKKVANRVVTQKRQYFVPAHGVNVEADNAADAVKQAKKLKQKQEKDGDA